MDDATGDGCGHGELIAALEEQVALLVDQNERLLAELEKLRREKGRHSGNSGKPPSSDTMADKDAQADQRLSRQERRRLARAKAKELADPNRGRPKRKPGKQPGEAGARLDPVDDPDDVV